MKLAIAAAVSLNAAPVLANEPPMPILLTNVNVWDGVSDGLNENANVVVTGNLITEVAAPTGQWKPYLGGPLGKIETCAYADILLIDGNPPENIAVLRANPGQCGAPDQAASESPTKISSWKSAEFYKNTLD